jgi:hypothetical protein
MKLVKTSNQAMGINELMALMGYLNTTNQHSFKGQPAGTLNMLGPKTTYTVTIHLAGVNDATRTYLKSADWSAFEDWELVE